MNTISSAQIQELRLRAQHLHRPDNQPDLSVGQLMSAVFALQAQDKVAAYRSLWVRGGRYMAETDVTHALEEERSVVRTWCMRGTLHLLPAADLGWLLPLFGSRFIRQTRRRYEQLGLTVKHFRRANGLLPRLLNKEGPLTRPELARQLADEGIPTQGQAIHHLLRRAALEGIICFGPGRNGEETYVALETWLEMSNPLADNEALALLARRYLRAFGPATPADMAAWSGLSKTQCRSGFSRNSDDLLELATAAGPIWLLRDWAGWLDEPAGNQTTVRLLPGYDAFLLGYQDRDLTVPTAYAKEVHPGGGLIRATVLVNGRAAGTWKVERRKNNLVVKIAPFFKLNEGVMSLLEEEVQDLGRFHDMDTVRLLVSAP
jgi:uncharacterized protein YcaQ